jgi:hypothetical protein
MKHEDIRELLALDLYRETDARQRAQLAEHLRTCASCRTFQSELANGLGQLTHTERELEPVGDLRARLETKIGAEQRSRTRVRWLAVAASFAAGALVTWIVLRPAPPPSQPWAALVQSQPATPFQRFQRAEPPPECSTSPSWSRITAEFAH